jgi:hypothetical protein
VGLSRDSHRLLRKGQVAPFARASAQKKQRTRVDRQVPPSGKDDPWRLCKCNVMDGVLNRVALTFWAQRGGSRD